MKARGRWLLGIDFDAPKDGPNVLAIPMRGNVPQWHQAESIHRNAIEDMIDKIRDKERERRQAAEREADEQAGR